MKCEVLVSTMNKTDYYQLKKEMNLNDCVIINQVTNNADLIRAEENDLKFLSFREKGLSKSRNKAINNSTAEICMLADDDMYYLDGYEKAVCKAYNDHLDADMIAFVVPHDNRKSKKILKEGKVNFLNIMRIQSVQVSFKRKSIIEKNIRFDENFGAGTKYFCGEETIFLNDCRRSGLNIYFVPVEIARLKDTGVSTWFKGFDKQYFYTRGAIYYRMSKKIYMILILQFAIRKYKMYKNECGFFKAIKLMLEGKREYKKDRSKK